MKRLIYQSLKEWKTSSARKPIIIRGARQVGKTSAVRHFGKAFKHYVELNFEARPDIHSYFEGNLDPKYIIETIELLLNVKVVVGETLLFFDEAQACPRSLIALRYFYELMPDLHIIAAGSLLDIAIEKVGVPVGRVEFKFMYPMSFIEFLWAQGEERLAAFLVKQNVNEACSEVIHEKALKLFGEYIAVGGMPEAVSSWVSKRDYNACLKIHHDLVAAYEQDFPKYATDTQLRYIDVLFKRIPHQICRKFKFSNVGEYRSRELSPCLDLLCKAGVSRKVYHTSAQGFPLGAQTHLDSFKVQLVDVALTQAMLGQTSEQWILNANDAFINQGDIAEVVIGQELLVYQSHDYSAELYYWQREARGAEAEVDFVVANQHEVIPVEVKAGKGSSLKSMRIFLEEHKNSPFGVRFSTHNYSVYENLHSYPLYAVANFLGVNA